MLRELAVRDLALIERARVELGAGLTVITGETGAGKSLPDRCLELVMGAPGGNGLVRHGASGARSGGRCSNDDNDGSTDDPLICVREVSAEGRSVARIDDETVTVARRPRSIRFHRQDSRSQPDQQRLLKGACASSWTVRRPRRALAPGGSADAVRALRSNDAALRELATDRPSFSAAWSWPSTPRTRSRRQLRAGRDR